MAVVNPAKFANSLQTQSWSVHCRQGTDEDLEHVAPLLRRPLEDAIDVNSLLPVQTDNSCSSDASHPQPGRDVPVWFVATHTVKVNGDSIAAALSVLRPKDAGRVFLELTSAGDARSLHKLLAHAASTGALRPGDPLSFCAPSSVLPYLESSVHVRSVALEYEIRVPVSPVRATLSAILDLEGLTLEVWSSQRCLDELDDFADLVTAITTEAPRAEWLAPATRDSVEQRLRDFPSVEWLIARYRGAISGGLRFQAFENHIKAYLFGTKLPYRHFEIPFALNVGLMHLAHSRNLHDIRGLRDAENLPAGRWAQFMRRTILQLPGSTLPYQTWAQVDGTYAA